MTCQFQYQINHCEIAMDTSMTSPLSARITNKSGNWFAQSAWLRPIALNSLRFYGSLTIGMPLSIKNARDELFGMISFP